MKNKTLRKTLVAIPKGYKFVEILHSGRLQVKAIKDIPNGAEYHTLYVDEMVKKNEK